MPKKREAWTVCRFKGGGLGKKQGCGVLGGVGGAGGNTPMHTINLAIVLIVILIY